MSKTKETTETTGHASISFRRSAVLVEEVAWNIYKKTPIWVVDITNGFFPVKFEYKQRGYKGLVFSEQLSRVEFC